jgi:hypothetical protein
MCAPLRKPKKETPRGFLSNPSTKIPLNFPKITTKLPPSPRIDYHPTSLPPPVSSTSGGGGRRAMGDGAPTDASRRGPPVPGGGRSSHAPQDAATDASSPFTWQGGPLIGPLVALLAAAGAPPGMGVGAWPGFPSTGAPPGLGAGTWPFFPGAGVPPDQSGRRLHG